MRLLVTLALFVLPGLPASAQRAVVPLDGEWRIADSISGAAPPRAYPHTAPVPGLANLAQPPFADVDKFDSYENIDKKIRLKQLPASARLATAGIPHQSRNYFWYRRTFRAPARKEVAILKVNKAQFGTAVWLNGTKIGEHPGCFTAGFFNLTPAMNWSGENELVVRVGAHPAALPETAPAGTDNEKNLWTPGIYDSVSVSFSDNPVIESVQAAPRLAASEVVIQTRLRNYGGRIDARLTHRVAGESASVPVRMTAASEITETVTVRIPNPKLWTPESPHLYTLESSTGGDSLSTRFGMREFRFDTVTRRAYLNGKPYFLRGSNITLHRFFEDPKCGRLPWDEKWVRKLLAEIPKRMHWNAFRFCIGPVPDKWLEIADEAGLLIQNEFFVWGYRKQWDIQEMVRQYSDWMRDNWNHPSVAVWDAQNETRAEELSRIIAFVRGLDLSNRPWENGYNLPVGPDDPVEDHPYLFSRLGKGFEIADLERMTGAKSTNAAHPTGHPVIINEYGWLWLNRDGTPTPLTTDVYARLSGDRFENNAYLLGGLTEFWRAHRNAAAVLHFVYLTSSYPGAYTSDHFQDLENLTLEPHFADYVGEAFKPLGVYLNFWQPSLKPNTEQRFMVMMVNDEQQPARGSLVLSLSAEDGTEAARAEARFEVPGLGQQTYALNLRIPAVKGRFLIRAAAQPEGGAPTVSRRRVSIP